jgi:8-oxo-dGTP pyrophosphatase MutT (NUDIX family)
MAPARSCQTPGVPLISAMSFFNPKRLSCGVVILNPDRELLLCHVTGQNHWDLPKGGIDPGETPLQAALRETREEAGLQLDAQALLDLGRLPYTNKKDLHLFALCMPRIEMKLLRCESHYLDHHSGRRLPEMDGYGWFAFERIEQLCTPKMALVLGKRIDLDGLLDRLIAPTPAPLAAAPVLA